MTRSVPRISTRIVLSFLLFAAGAGGIVIRHDRDDSQYRASTEDFPALVEVGRAHGTLIAPEWVLTAAHVADGLSPISGTVRVGEREVGVAQVVLHPSWIGDLDPGLAEPDWLDLALVRLTEPVTDVAPVPLYEGQDEVDREMVFVGRGHTGTGRVGPTTPDGVLRRATNRVVRSDEDWLYFRFDEPPAGTDLEGISGPGDSGGPALLRTEDRVFVAGVSSRNDDRDPEEKHAGLGLCRYGTTEVYARLSTHLDWIRKTMRNPSGPGAVVSLSEEDWPDIPAARRAQELLAALRGGDPEELRRFADARSDGARSRVPSQDWVKFWSRYRQRSGPLTATHYAAFNDFEILVLTRSENHWRSLRVELEGDPPYRVRNLSVRRESRLQGRPLPPASSESPSKPMPRKPTSATRAPTTGGDG